MASPVVEQVVENSTNSAGTNHTINLPTPTAGQLLLIVLDKGSTSATVNAHGSLTELLDEASANGLYIAYRQMDGTESSPFTLVTSASTRTASLAYRISGHINPSVQAPQIGTTSSGTSATPDPPASAAPGSTQDYLFITFYGAAGEEADDDTWSDTPPTNFTPSPPRQKACGTAGTNLGGMIAAAERALNTGSALDPGTFAKDVSAAWRAQTIMISPANPQTVTPDTATLTLDEQVPTVTTTANVLAVPSTAALTITELVPTVTIESTGTTVTPDTASLSLTEFAPSINITQHQLVVPSTVSLVLTELVPTVTATNHQTVTPSTASLTITRFAPRILKDADDTGSGGISNSVSGASVSGSLWAA